MYVPFEKMPGHSKIWIYQSNRKFTAEEVEEIEKTLMAFVEQWAAHATPLHSSFAVKYDRFIILVVDQDYHSASGCSIDESVNMIQEIEKKYNVDLMDRMNVSYKSGEFIAYKSLIDFKKMVKNKAVSSQTIVFNNLVNDLDEFNDFWEVPASESWHSRFFK